MPVCTQLLCYGWQGTVVERKAGFAKQYGSRLRQKGDAVHGLNDSDNVSDSSSDSTMPSASTLTADDKARIKRAVPASGSTGTNKIITATCARVFRARPGEDECVRSLRDAAADARRWTYTGVEGALVFCADKVKGGLWFRVVDLTVGCHYWLGVCSDNAGKSRCLLGARATQ